MAAYKYRIDNGEFDPFKEYEYFFQSFLLYASETKKFVEEEIKTERQRYGIYMKASEISREYDGEQFYYEMDLNTKEGLSDIYFDSLIITLYSFVEKKMLSLCKYFEKTEKFKLDDIKGDGVLKYKKYLEKCGNLNFNEVKDEWRQLLMFKKIRNILVHSHGARIIPSNESELLHFLKASAGIVIAGEDNELTFHFETNEIIFSFHRCCKFIVDFLFHEKVSL